VVHGKQQKELRRIFNLCFSEKRSGAMHFSVRLSVRRTVSRFTICVFFVLSFVQFIEVRKRREREEDSVRRGAGRFFAFLFLAVLSMKLFFRTESPHSPTHSLLQYTKERTCGQTPFLPSFLPSFPLIDNPLFDLCIG